MPVMRVGMKYFAIFKLVDVDFAWLDRFHFGEGQTKHTVLELGADFVVLNGERELEVAGEFDGLFLIGFKATLLARSAKAKHVVDNLDGNVDTLHTRELRSDLKIIFVLA